MNQKVTTLNLQIKWNNKILNYLVFIKYIF